MDRILIEALRCRAFVGVSRAERRRRQPLLLDLSLELNLRQAGRLDQVRKTVDYAAVVRQVRGCVEGRPFVLVEAVAEAVADVVLKRFKPRRVQVRVRKFSVPGTHSVGVEVTRLC